MCWVLDALDSRRREGGIAQGETRSRLAFVLPDRTAGPDAASCQPGVSALIRIAAD